MKKKLIILLGSIFILIGLFFLFVVGITTDFISDEIEASEIAKCKEIVSIIDRNSNFIKDSISLNADGDGKCIRYYIENNEDISKLFSKINIQDKQKFQQLLNTKFCQYIEISEAKNCIMFCIKTSEHDYSIVGAYKKMFIIYEKDPICNCKDNPIGYPNYPEYVKVLSKNWYQTKVNVSKRHFGC
ncbi:hypothetical protein NLG42_15550 [Flavobacterium plurextorum]|uniref:Uncharacterized protein n=1 Tax=Flavobacterium plurextorum TaxID=1114867 RepID=A0ABX4CYF7_9FLAO|nr:MULTISPECIES: hypothetical protein [Flavobacterium]OXB10677.1 hypothetical protein B0A81_03715 [Flavobacterium plurextorum]UUW07516.1 hypothetical protein NLG42_15550 [Flavobacterium plurextorum]